MGGTICDSWPIKGRFGDYCSPQMGEGGAHGFEVKYRGGDTHNRVRRIPSHVFVKGGGRQRRSPVRRGNVKEEVFYHIHGMRSLPNIRRRRPSAVRQVSQPYYRNTGGNWRNFRQRNNYAVRWTAGLKINRRGHYTFWTYSDDGSKLYIDHRLAVNNDGLHGWRGRAGGRHLNRGTHAFRAEFFERGGSNPTMDAISSDVFVSKRDHLNMGAIHWEHNVNIRNSVCFLQGYRSHVLMLREALWSEGPMGLGPKVLRARCCKTFGRAPECCKTPQGRARVL